MDYNTIETLIKSINIFDSVNLFKQNKNLTNFTNQVLSMAIPVFDTNNGGFSEVSYYSIIRDEIIQNISKSVTRKIFDTTDIEYFDLTKTGIFMMSMSDRKNLANLSLYCSDGYKNMITCGMVAAELEDTERFSPIVQNSQINSSGKLYTIGKFAASNLIVDPYMKFNDSRIAFYNDIEVNIKDLTSTIQSESTFAPRLMVNYKLDYNVGNTKLLWILESTSPPEAILQYKQRKRDITIDDLLNNKLSTS